jgi:hypothetical protein
MATVPLKLMVCDWGGSCVPVRGHGLLVEGSVVEVRDEEVQDLMDLLQDALDELEEEE